MDSLVVQLIDRVNELHENGAEEVTGVRTGFYDLDRMTAGLQPGDLIVLAARPSMGKTALALNIAEHVAVQRRPAGRRVLDGNGRLAAGAAHGRLARPHRPAAPAHRRAAATTNGAACPRRSRSSARSACSSTRAPALTPSELRARARRQARQCGQLGLIVVDYLQLMSGSGGTSDENRATVIGEISRGLKSLAKELKCPVIALSQLNRSVESAHRQAADDERPARVRRDRAGRRRHHVHLPRRVLQQGRGKEPGIAEIIIGKQRNGPTGTVKLTSCKPLTKFDNLAPGSGGSDY